MYRFKILWFNFSKQACGRILVGFAIQNFWKRSSEFYPHFLWWKYCEFQICGLDLEH